MKKLDLSLISSMDFVQEEQYLLTRNELDLLNKGELTFHNGILYRTKDIPREIPTIDLTPDESLPLLNLYGDEKLLKDIPDPLTNKHLSDKGDFSAQSLHPSFNRPTHAQIERCKQFPPVEIKGVQLKDSKLNTTAKQAVEQLMKSIRINGGKHPFTWVEEAGMLAEFSGDKSIPFLLEILNAAIPLKEGMKLEGFSAKEFEQKYLYSRPSLLEAWTAGDAQLIDNIRKETEKSKVIEQPYLTLGVHEIPPHKNAGGLFETVNPEASDKLKTILNKMKPIDQNDDRKLVGLGLWNVAGVVVAQYIDQVDAGTYEGNWSVGLAKQDKYWDLFRGQTINIIRLGLQLKVGDMSKYALPTPIEGMK